MKNKKTILAKLKLRDNRSVIIYFKNNRWKTGVFVNDKSEFSEGRLNRKYKGKENYHVLNNLLANKLNFFNKLILHADHENLNPLDYIKTYIKGEEKKLKNLKITHNSVLCDVFEHYVLKKQEEFKDFKKASSFSRYETELNRLKIYESICPTTIQDIDFTWIQNFCRWLSKPFMKEYFVEDIKNDRSYKRKLELKQTNSTIKRFLQDLITFFKLLKEAQPQLQLPIKEATQFMNDLQSPENDDNVISLSEDQYLTLRNYIPTRDWEKRTYYIYMFCVFTGLRYSDATILNSNYVNENYTIAMRAVKTGNRFSVGMNKAAKEIYLSYDSDFNKKFPSNQQINKNLSKILKRLEAFNCPVMKYEYVLGKRTPTIKKAHEVITFHSSRRTFVTRKVNAGARPQDIKDFTGWTDNGWLESYYNQRCQKTQTQEERLKSILEAE